MPRWFETVQGLGKVDVAVLASGQNGFPAAELPYDTRVSVSGKFSVHLRDVPG